MIKPTVGRVVWFWPHTNDNIIHNQGKPLAAHVACVWSDSCVNLMVIDANGNPQSRASVLLVQEGEVRPAGGYCEWMPYQKGQAAKTEQLEAKLSEAAGVE